MILFLMVQYLEGTGADGENNERRRKVIPRYIEATKLEELCDIMADKCDGNGKSSWKQFRTAVECSPTADVVEVVRCKNCKHSYYDSELEKYWCTNYSGSIEKSADGFCDDGKPRSE